MTTQTNVNYTPRTAAQQAMPDRRGREWFNQAFLISVLTFMLLLTLVPIILMIVMSLKDNGQIYGRFWAPPDPIRWQNYTTGYEAMSGYIRNSLIYSLVSVFGVGILSSLSGYVFARHRFPFKNVIYMAVLSLLMIPAVLTLIPSFVLVKNLGLVNTPFALILPWTAGGQVLGILLTRTFFATLPQELFDSAKIDGASELQLYYRIAVPLSWPIIITVGILHLVATYNDFIWPLLTVTNSDIQVVSVGLTEFTSQFGIVDWGPRMAAYTVATIPLLMLFMFGMRYYIRGITTGAIKA